MNVLSGWAAIAEAGVTEVGGKAWQLAQLAQLGFSVPAALVVPCAVYRAWAASTTDSEPSHVPLALVQALTTQLQQLGWEQLPLVVRSSAAQEDSAHASFAGIYRSCLNVQGSAALEAALLAVWQSLQTPAARAYRQRLALAEHEAAMAVLIMPLLPAHASGIGFTCDPLTGRTDRVVIQANWGLGEVLVSGAVVGDVITLGETADSSELQPVEYRCGAKTHASWPKADGGTQLQPLAEARATQAVLSPEQALQLGKLLRLAAQALDFTQAGWDGEWVWDGQQFWLVQLRPVTALAQCTYPELAQQALIWSRGNTCDVVPDPLSPIDWSVSRKLVNALLGTGYTLTGFPVQPGVQRGGLFEGRLYLNLSLLQWEGYQAFAVLPEAMNRLVGGHQPCIEVPALTWQQRVRRAWGMLRFMVQAPRWQARGRREIALAYQCCAAWRDHPPPLQPAALAARMREVSAHGARAQGLHFMQGSGGASLSLLVDWLERYFPGEGHALSSALLAGASPSVTAEQNYQLLALARLAMAEPAIEAWLIQTPRSEWQTLPDSPFRRALADFLQRYGHRGIYETYLRNPRWREQPDYLLDSLPALAKVDLAALQRRQHATRSQAAARIRHTLPCWSRWVLKQLLNKATQDSNGREAARSALIAYAEVSRLGLLSIGRHWVTHGWLTQPEEVFLLLDTEILAVLDGQRSGQDLAALVARRQQLEQRWWQTTVPEVLVFHPSTTGRPAAATITTDPLEATAASFHGTPVGGGVAVGQVRRLYTPEQGQCLQLGEILLVPSTDPAWTPLFLKAGGLIMETGGFLSHGAIVARELGIPAVVNLPGILQALADGEMVQVDGDRGVIRRVTAVQV